LHLSHASTEVVEEDKEEDEEEVMEARLRERYIIETTRK
jgi:hypothetical protein